MIASTLCIETAQVRNVPRVVRELSCLHVLQTVCAAVDDFRDDEGSLPWGGELVHLLLLQAQD